MSTALRYSLQQPGAPALALEVPQGGVTRAHLPDPQSKARFIAAVAKARCGDGEALELLGEPVESIDSAARIAIKT